MLPRPSQPVAPFLRIFYDWDLLGVAVEGRTEAQGSAQAFPDAHMIEPLGLARCGFSGICHRAGSGDTSIEAVPGSEPLTRLCHHIQREGNQRL